MIWLFINYNDVPETIDLRKIYAKRFIEFSSSLSLNQYSRYHFVSWTRYSSCLVDIILLATCFTSKNLKKPDSFQFLHVQFPLIRRWRMNEWALMIWCGGGDRHRFGGHLRTECVHGGGVTAEGGADRLHLAASDRLGRSGRLGHLRLPRGRWRWVRWEGDILALSVHLGSFGRNGRYKLHFI